MAQGKAVGGGVTARVLADLSLNTESQSLIARKNGVSEGTVKNIKKKYLADFARLKKAVPEGELIAPLATNLLVQSLVTLTIQMEQFGDKEWLARQSAGELALLFGILNDKTIRLLAAAQRSQDRPQDRAEDAPRERGGLGSG